MCFSSFDGHDEEGTLEINEEAALDGNMRINGSDVPKETKIALRQMPTWLSNSTPDEFLVRAFIYIEFTILLTFCGDFVI